MDIDFNEAEDWNQATNGAWKHRGGCVASFNILQTLKNDYTYKYRDNQGDLLPIKDFLNTTEKCIVPQFMGKIIKAGESYIGFDVIYEAMTPFGRFKLNELYIKEQIEKDYIVPILYMNHWFVVAPITKVEENIGTGKYTCLKRTTDKRLYSTHRYGK